VLVSEKDDIKMTLNIALFIRAFLFKVDFFLNKWMPSFFVIRLYNSDKIWLV